MLNAALLRNEVYLIASASRTICYAPLTRGISLYSGSISMEDVDLAWMKENTDIRRVPNFIKREGFVLDTNKVRLRLNITSGCNLRCGYCSVNANGHKVENMPEKIALAAIDSFCKLAEVNGSEVLEIVFSGGEPTLRASFMRLVIDHAKKVIPSDVRLASRMLTNGLFDYEENIDILDDLHEIQVSWDGFSDISPRYGDSYEIAMKVWENIGRLVGDGKSFSVLTVVSDRNSSSIRTVVDQLYDRGVKNIFLALEENLGRSKGEKSKDEYATLKEEYLSLWAYYRERGLDINLTGTDIHSVSPYPCSVPVPNYSVAPDGVVSACTISFNDDKENSETFKLGSISSGKLSLDEAKVKSMSQYNVLNLPECADCFAKWHCRGGCLYAKKGDWFGKLSEERCEMIRKVVAGKLMYIIKKET